MKNIHSWVPIYYDITQSVALTAAESTNRLKSERKDTPYIALGGELWGVNAIIWEKIDRVITASHCIMISGKQSLFEFW